MEQLTVCTSAHLICIDDQRLATGALCTYTIIITKIKSHSLTNNSGLQIYKHSPGDVLSSSGLTEEGVEGVITSSNGLVAGHLPIRLDAVLKTIEFPAGIADLDSSLTNVDRDALTLCIGMGKSFFIRLLALKAYILCHHYVDIFMCLIFWVQQ